MRDFGGDEYPGTPGPRFHIIMGTRDPPFLHDTGSGSLASSALFAALVRISTLIPREARFLLGVP